MLIANLSKADKVFIGKSILTLEDSLESLESASEEYRYATQFLPYSDLAAFREELDGYRKAIDYFYTRFCPSVGLDEYKVAELVSLYKTISVTEYFELKKEITLTDVDLFGEGWRV